VGNLNTDETPAGGPGPIPWSDVTAFVRHLAHDIRNDLNVLGLEAMLLEDVIARGKVTVADLAAIRAATRVAEERLRKLSEKVQPLSPQQTPSRAEDLLEHVKLIAEKARLVTVPDRWSFTAADVFIDADLDLLSEAILEVLSNAFYFRQSPSPISLETTFDGRNLQVTIRESISPVPSEHALWGIVPLAPGERGGYGLGLNFATRIVAAHGGFLKRTIFAAEEILETLISIPASTKPPA
jgi:signal transduction histidine kinase